MRTVARAKHSPHYRSDKGMIYHETRVHQRSWGIKTVKYLSSIDRNHFYLNIMIMNL